MGILKGIILDNQSEIYEIYMVRRQDGKWLRTGSGSQSWVTDIDKAKIYKTIGPARAQATWWAGSFPKYGIPDVTRLVVTKIEVLEGERKRVESSLKKICDRKEKANIYAREAQKKYAEECLEWAQKELETFKNEEP